MKIDFRINESFGQLLVNAKASWTAGPNTQSNCLSATTQIWVAVRTASNETRYIKLSPGIVAAGQGFGPSGSTSPSWSSLFCFSADSTASCEIETRTRELLLTVLQFESFDVITEAQSLSDLQSDFTRKATTSKPADSSALDALLNDAIDSTYSSNESLPADNGVVAESAELAEAADTSKVDSAQSAKATAERVVALFGSSLSQYTAPAHACESERTTSQWAQVRGTCEFTLRQESNHDFLCESDGQPQSIHTTSSAKINLAKDVRAFTDIRVSPEGWAAFVIELNSDLHNYSIARLQTNRWQITTDNGRLADIQELGRSLESLTSYCRDNPSG